MQLLLFCTNLQLLSLITSLFTKINSFNKITSAQWWSLFPSSRLMYEKNNLFSENFHHFLGRIISLVWQDFPGNLVGPPNRAFSLWMSSCCRLMLCYMWLAFPSPFYDKVGLVGLLLLSDIVIGSEAKTFFASFIVDVSLILTDKKLKKIGDEKRNVLCLLTKDVDRCKNVRISVNKMSPFFSAIN